MIPFAAYTPDQPALENPGTDYVNNVVPLTVRSDGGTSYGPLGQLVEEGNAVGANRVQGAFSARTEVGNVTNFAADASALYQQDGADWDDVSKAGGYTVDAEDTAEFVQFGDRVICALGNSDNLQSFVLGSSTLFADLAVAAPRAYHIATIRDFVMVGRTWDTTDGDVRNRVWWSAFNDPTDWPTIGSADAAAKQSDFQDIPTGDIVQKITGAIGGTDGAIFMENAIYRVTYEGPPTVFRFTEIERGRGAYARNSVVNIGSGAFFLAEDGFYFFNGTQATPVGNQKVDKTFFADFNQFYRFRMVGAADVLNKVVMWVYPSTNSSDGTPDKAIMYNWAIDRWSQADLNVEFLARSLSEGYTLEELDAFGTIDTLPLSLDARAWTGGALQLAAFSTNNKLAKFSSTPLEAQMETTETTGAKGSRIMVTGIRPYVDGGTPTVQLRTRGTPQASLTDSAFEPVNSDGMAHFNISTRYARARVRIAAGGSWSHAQGIDVDSYPDGDL